MTGLPWFKCYPRDFNDGMMGLTLDERGAYVTILNVIYARGGPIDDDPSYFRALLYCSPKAWSKIRAALIVKRKLFEVSVDGVPSLMNRRAAEEIEENREMRRKFSERGAKGGQKSQAILKENKALGQQQADLGSTIEDTESEQKETPSVSCPISSDAPAKIEAFDRFWKAYPSKTGKGAARTAYAKAATKLRKTGADPHAVMLTAVERAKASARWKDPTYTIPNPATWLNQERWDDETCPVVAGSSATADPALHARHEALMRA